MESLSSKHALIFTNMNKPKAAISLVPFRTKLHRKPRRFRIHSKTSDFQDFQVFAKPLRLLPAEEVKILEKDCNINVDESRSLFKVIVQTSNKFGSSLTNSNAGLLLCLIDEYGDSVLQRIPSTLTTKDSSETECNADDERLNFQRGSVDEFTFEGPKLSRIKALWISLESGQWRLGGTSLMVVNARRNTLNVAENLDYVGLQYDFKTDDILLGEGADISMVELRPCLVTEAFAVDPLTLLNNSPSLSSSLSTNEMSNEESMKEYADLKLSLLLYDAILIFLGTLVASLSIGESSGIAYLIGGAIGFLYLLLLQRSVDGLQVPGSISQNPVGNLGQILEGFRGSVLILALAVGSAVVAVKYNPGDGTLALTPKELLAGTFGFLSCKVAVVLAAFKPLPVDLKERK